MPMFTVIGMLGALGKMNLTSSNFPRLRHVSASDTLVEKAEGQIQTRIVGLALVDVLTNLRH